MQPAGINGSGTVVGVYNGTYTHAFEYNPATGTRDLGTLGGLTAGAERINDFGTIVGGSQLLDGSGAAFIYTDSGGMVDLNTLVSLSGWTLDDAVGVNESGQIICQGVNANSVYHGFLLTPVPEPSTGALLFATACAAIFLARILRSQRLPRVRGSDVSRLIYR